MSQNPTRIAIVDDDLAVRRSLGHLLRSGGFEPDAFDSAESFLEALGQPDARAFDCALIDVQMPGKTGLQLQERLREIRPALPVILFSANDDPAVRERALSAGAVAFLRKPVTEETLFKCIAESLSAPSD